MSVNDWISTLSIIAGPAALIYFAYIVLRSLLESTLLKAGAFSAVFSRKIKSPISLMMGILVVLFAYSAMNFMKDRQAVAASSVDQKPKVAGKPVPSAQTSGVQVASNGAAPTPSTQNATDQAADPEAEEFKQIKKKFNFELYEKPARYWRYLPSTVDDPPILDGLKGKTQVDGYKIGEKFIFTSTFKGFKYTKFIRHDYEYFLRNELTITCKDIVIWTDPAGKLSLENEGNCSYNIDKEYPEDYRIWQKDDGSFVDASKNVIISKDNNIEAGG